MTLRHVGGNVKLTNTQLWSTERRPALSTANLYEQIGGTVEFCRREFSRQNPISTLKGKGREAQRGYLNYSRSPSQVTVPERISPTPMVHLAGETLSLKPKQC